MHKQHRGDNDLSKGLINTTHGTCRRLLAVICIFMCASLFRSGKKKTGVARTRSPTCVCLALTSAILLSWAVVAARHPTGAPTRVALKCQRAPHMEKAVPWVYEQTGAWGVWVGGSRVGWGGWICQDERRCSPAVCSASPNTKEKTQDLRESIFAALCVCLSRW